MKITAAAFAISVLAAAFGSSLPEMAVAGFDDAGSPLHVSGIPCF